MKKRKILGLSYKGKKFKIETKSYKGLDMGIGLMFKSSDTGALLFEFEKPNKMALTSLFVFFDFVAVFLDDKNKILDLKIVKPFTWMIKSEKPFKKIVEIPINKKYSEIIRILVGNAKDL